MPKAAAVQRPFLLGPRGSCEKRGGTHVLDDPPRETNTAAVTARIGLAPAWRAAERGFWAETGAVGVMMSPTSRLRTRSIEAAARPARRDDAEMGSIDELDG